MASRPFTYILFPIAIFFSLIAHGQTVVNDSVVASIHRFKQNISIKSVVPFDKRFLCLDEDEKLFFVDSNSSQIDSSINKYSTDYDFEKLQVIDSVIVGTEGYQEGHKRFFLDTAKKKWRHYRAKKHIYPGDLIFQDDEYFISNTCSGEWGGTIYFANKKTSKIYESECTCAVNVIKGPNNYNVTASLSHMGGSATVFNVNDPKMLKLHLKRKPRQLLDSLKSAGFATSESNSTIGIEKLVDTVGATLAGSFRFKNSLLYLVENRPMLSPPSFWIDSIQNKKLVPIRNLNEFGIVETGYDHFNSDEVFITTFDDEHFSGFICIIKDKLNLYIFHRLKK